MADIKLFLQIRNFCNREGRDNGEHRWYVIGEKNHQNHRDAQAGVVVGGGEEAPSSLFISGIPLLNRNFGRRTISTFRDSTIYVCGGINFYTRRHISIPNYKMELNDVWDASIYCNDDGDIVCQAANNDDGGGGWNKNLPSMLLPRRGGCAVCVDGKLFVFGGFTYLYPDLFAEVFHFDTSQWVSLPPHKNMPFENVHACVVFDYNNLVIDCMKNEEDGKKKWVILVYLRACGILFSYDLTLHKWDIFDAFFDSWADQLVLSDSGTILFTIHKRVLHGYDLRRREWFNEPVKNFKVYDVLLPSYFNEFHLVSLGSATGKFCVVWADRPEGHPHLRVCCIKLIVYQDGQSSLAAKVEPTIAFNLDHGEELICCLAFAPHQEKKKRGGTSSDMEVNHDDEENKRIKLVHP